MAIHLLPLFYTCAQLELALNFGKACASGTYWFREWKTRRMTHSIDQSEDHWSMAKISWIPVDPDTAESYFAFSLSLLFILLQSGRVLRSSSICFLYNFYKTSDTAAEPLNSLLNFPCFISSRSFKKAILTELSILTLIGFSTMHSTFKIHKIFIELFLG